MNSFRINCVWYSLGFTDLKTSRDKNLMAKLCVQKEAVLLRLHMNPPLSIVCSLPYSPPTSQLKTSIILKHWQKYSYMFSRKNPLLSQTAPTSNTTFPVYPSYTITMNAPTQPLWMLQLAGCLVCPFCNNISGLQLIKYWCCQFINDFYFLSH